MLAGGWLIFASCVLAAWFVGLVWALQTSIRGEPRLSKTRNRLAGVGLALGTLSVAFLLLLALSWFSPKISQHFRGTAGRIFFSVGFWSTPAGLVLGIAGIGMRRLLAVGTSIVAGMCWLWLSVAAAISMGPPIVRHPIRYLIPDGYVGWVQIRHNEQGAPPLPFKNGFYLCRIPSDGVLPTSSGLEDGWARDEYFYYSSDGSLRELTNTGWGGGGIIWGELTGSQSSARGNANQIYEAFFVGTEDQFHRSPGFRPTGAR